MPADEPEFFARSGARSGFAPRGRLGGPFGFRGCLVLCRPLPPLSRHVLEASGDVPRGCRQPVKDLGRLSFDPVPRRLHQVLKAVLVLPEASIVAPLEHGPS